MFKCDANLFSSAYDDISTAKSLIKSFSDSINYFHSTIYSSNLEFVKSSIVNSGIVELDTLISSVRANLMLLDENFKIGLMKIEIEKSQYGSLDTSKLTADEVMSYYSNSDSKESWYLILAGLQESIEGENLSFAEKKEIEEQILYVKAQIKKYELEEQLVGLDQRSKEYLQISKEMAEQDRILILLDPDLSMQERLRKSTQFTKDNDQNLKSIEVMIQLCDGILPKIEESDFIKDIEAEIKVLNDEKMTLEQQLTEVEMKLSLTPLSPENSELRSKLEEEHAKLTKRIEELNLQIGQKQSLIKSFIDYSKSSYYNEIGNNVDFEAISRVQITKEEKEVLEEVGFYYSSGWYKFLKPEEREMAHYLYVKQGEEALKEYSQYLRQELNSREGMYNAMIFVNNLGPVGLDYINVHMKGVIDGIDQFGEGFANFFGGLDRIVSVDQYETMYIAYLLNEKAKTLGATYDISSGIGNMLPSMAASALGTLVGMPWLGNVTMAISAAGNTAERAYQQGYSYQQSMFYGTLLGGAEAALERLFGGIPLLSKLDDIPGFKGFLLSSLGEGATESLEKILDPIIQSFVLGKEIEIDWEEVAKAGIYGIITAAYLKGAKTVIINGVDIPLDYATEIADPISRAEKTGIKIDYSKIFSAEYIESLKYDIMGITPEMQLQQLAEAKGMSLEELGAQKGNTQQIDSRVQEMAKNLANSIREKAEKIEPIITADMHLLETDYAHLVGLDYKLKGVESLSRKILSDSQTDNVPLDLAASSIGDSVRYTLLIDDAYYQQHMDECLDKLISKGYTINKFKNFWGNKIYQGINVSLISPDGTTLELQFHTKDSFDTKQNINHLYYEIARNQFTTEEEKLLANKIMEINQSKVNVPEKIIGYEYE